MRATVASLFCALTLACGSNEPLGLSPALPPTPALTARVSFPEVPGAPFVEGLVRATLDETALGLMYRKELLGEHEGMLFVFGHDADHSFWMKNTFVPLDMVFVTASGEVAGVVADVPPETTASRRVGKPSRYVLEVGGGWAKAHGVGAGAVARIELRQAQPAVARLAQ